MLLGASGLNSLLVSVTLGSGGIFLWDASRAWCSLLHFFFCFWEGGTEGGESTEPKLHADYRKCRGWDLGALLAVARVIAHLVAGGLHLKKCVLKSDSRAVRGGMMERLVLLLVN